MQFGMLVAQPSESCIRGCYVTSVGFRNSLRNCHMTRPLAKALPDPQTSPSQAPSRDGQNTSKCVERVAYSFGGASTVEYGPAPSKPLYQETPLDHLAIALFTRKVAAAASVSTPSEPWRYESFLEVSREIAKGKSAQDQWADVVSVLTGLMPALVLATIRKLVRPTRWVCEQNAAVAVQAFGWLVGPMTREEVEVNGVTQMSCVRIKRCRYLEESGCVGQCVNVCKIPTQLFFNQHFGVPLTMKPDFEDLSCKMVFGEAPPPLEEDPVMKEPCFSTCKLASRATVSADNGVQDGRKSLACLRDI